MDRPICPVCGEEGEHYPGTARGAVRHFFARAIWACHRLRQAAEADGQGQMAAAVSAIIRTLEDIYERLFEDRRH